ncbi:MAG: transglycosylase SLT domain-containing protein [Rhodocyclales bacterium]|nr:transglycosylase SLT domain-containing protein [Rhodocyclales bacterium]
MYTAIPSNSSAVLGFLRLSLTVVGLFLTAAFVNAIAGNAYAIDALKIAIPQLVPLSSETVADELEPVAEQPLSPRMQAVLGYVAQRYRVSSAALVPVFAAAQKAGRAQRIDPLLIVAIIGIESGFNPLAESSMGAQGLMQIIPRFHLDKVPDGAGEAPFLDPVINVQVGALVLEEAVRRHGGLVAGLQQYGGAVDDEEHAYANRVLAEKQRLEQAASRRSSVAA